MNFRLVCAATAFLGIASFSAPGASDSGSTTQGQAPRWDDGLTFRVGFDVYPHFYYDKHFGGTIGASTFVLGYTEERARKDRASSLGLNLGTDFASGMMKFNAYLAMASGPDGYALRPLPPFCLGWGLEAGPGVILADSFGNDGSSGSRSWLPGGELKISMLVSGYFGIYRKPNGSALYLYGVGANL